MPKNQLQNGAVGIENYINNRHRLNNSEVVMKYKIEHNRPDCIGCAACAAVAPNHWEMNEDGKYKKLLSVFWGVGSIRVAAKPV